MSGLNIKILGLTKSSHFSIIENACAEGGDLDWELLINDDGWHHVFTRKSWGFDGGVKFSYCRHHKILQAECYTN